MNPWLSRLLAAVPETSLRKCNAGSIFCAGSRLTSSVIDGDFGQKSEDATKFFQIKFGLSPNGKVNNETLRKAEEFGYTIKLDDYYQAFPPGFLPRPADLNTPSNTFRNQTFTCFKFKQLKLSVRGDDDGAVITGSCDGTINNWSSQKIIDIESPQLDLAICCPGRLTCHRRAADSIKAVLKAWEDADPASSDQDLRGLLQPPGTSAKSLRATVRTAFARA